MSNENKKAEYYGSEKDVRRNVILYMLDGVSFMPSMALISMATVIPFFLEQLGASTIQIAMAATIATVCIFVSQPIFGSIASRTRVMSQTFGKILMIQRIFFLVFVLSIPLFAPYPAFLIWLFLFAWGVFNLLAGSGNVFNVPLIMKLLPPDKRAGMRGIGFAIGNIIGVGMAALIPVILGRIAYPYNFMVIFSLGLFFLFLNAAGFLLMREHEDALPRVPMKVLEYIKGIPACLREDAAFRAMIFFSMFLVLSNALIPFYTLYAIRTFSITESHIATLTTLSIATGIFINIFFGFLIDRKGPKKIAPLAACFVILAGATALFASSLFHIYIAWVLAHLGNGVFMKTSTLLLGVVSPADKVPLYTGVFMTVTMALSSVFVLLLSPVLEYIGFSFLFITVLVCGTVSLLINLLSFQRKLTQSHR